MSGIIRTGQSLPLLSRIMRTRQRYLVVLAIVLLLSVEIDAARRKKTKLNPVKGKAGKDDTVAATAASTTEGTVEGTVEEKLAYYDILKDYETTVGADKGKKHFKGDSLAFVTPWNARGYDTAKEFSAKFSYVSPVWFQVDGNLALDELDLIRGGHDIDQEWVAEVRRGGAKIVPRFLWDGWSSDQYLEMFRDPAKMRKVARAVGETLRRNRFEGAVLDFGFLRVAAIGEPYYYLIQAIHEHLLLINCEVILVVPPNIEYAGEQLFSAADFDNLHMHVEKFQIMTYDYVAPDGRPSGNAPTSWITKSVTSLVKPSKRSPEMMEKIMVGINFYGKDHSQGGVSHILGDGYIELLQQHQPDLEWDEDLHEHMFKYTKAGSEHTVYYPTLQYVQERLELAATLGVGVAIWEVGQGLPYFMDLF